MTGPLGDRIAAAEALWANDPDAAADAWLIAVAEAGAEAPDRVRARAGQIALFVGRIDDAVRTLAADADGEAPDALPGPGSVDLGYRTLQRANVVHWRDAPGDASRAERWAERAEELGLRFRDGPLALAAACLAGELALAGGRARDAVHAFGRARGLSEFAHSDAASVAPLAGLARAHLGWRNPRRGPELAERALERAERVGDPSGVARALRAVGAVRRDAEALARAAVAADRAPHRPFAVRLRREAIEIARATGAPDPFDAAEAARIAAELGAVGDAAALRRLSEVEPT